MLWGPTSFFFDGYVNVFPRVQRPGRDAGGSFLLVPCFELNLAKRALLHVTSWLVQRQMYRYPIWNSITTFSLSKTSRNVPWTYLQQFSFDVGINLLTPNVNYSGRTAPLTSKVAFYIFIQQIKVPNILNMVYTLRFFLFKMQFVS